MGNSLNHTNFSLANGYVSPIGAVLNPSYSRQRCHYNPYHVGLNMGNCKFSPFKWN